MKFAAQRTMAPWVAVRPRHAAVRLHTKWILLLASLIYGKVLDKHQTKAAVNRDSVYWTSTPGASASTRFRIGSITKSLVALSALRLVEQGKLALDAKYRDLAPEIPFRKPLGGNRIPILRQ